MGQFLTLTLTFALRVEVIAEVSDGRWNEF